MKFLCLFIHCIGLFSFSFSQELPFSAGILFSRHTKLDEFSSQLNLTAKQQIILPNTFSLQFEISIWDAQKYGTIFSLTSDSIFTVCVLYDRASKKDTSYFRINIGGKETQTSIPIAKKLLHRGVWYTLRFNFNLYDGTFTAYCNNTSYFSGKFSSAQNATRANLIFGDAEDPAMALRHIQIIDIKKKEILHWWKLNEEEGSVARDEIGKSDGIQTGLQWLAPLHQQWQYDTTFVSHQWNIYKPNFERDWRTGIIWNDAEHSFYIFDRKKIFIYSLRTRSLDSSENNTDWTAIVLFDSKQRERYNLQAGSGKVMRWNVKEKKWKPFHPYINPDSLQFGAPYFINPLNGDILSFGGYGWFTFKNTLRKYNFSTEQWDTIITRGEIPEPRTAMGIAEGKDSTEILLYGGYGSFTGSQHDGEHLFYDLWSLDLRTYTMKRLWKKEIELFSRGWFSLYKISTNEYLYLTKKTTGDGIRYSFYRGTLYSDSLEFLYDTLFTTGGSEFFYDSYNNQMVQLYSGEDSLGKSHHIVSTRAYPFLQKTEKQNRASNLLYVYSIGGILLAAMFGWILFKRKRNLHNSAQTEKVQERKSSLYFFGHFKVIDVNGKEITDKVTPKILQLFLLVLLSKNSYEGITTEKLTTLLWPESDADSAKNLRGVTINKLRAFLSKIGNITVEHSHKHWHVVFGDDVYCDFHEYQKSLNKINENEYTIEKILPLLERGNLLQDVHFETIDEIKQALRDEVTMHLQKFIKKQNGTLSIENKLRCCNIILAYDLLNEQIFRMKLQLLFAEGRAGEAKQCYDKFSSEWKNTFEEVYPKQLKDLL